MRLFNSFRALLLAGVALLLVGVAGCDGGVIIWRAGGTDGAVLLQSMEARR